MNEPTMQFRPFGPEGPKVLLFGKRTGNWNPSRFQKNGDHLSDRGLYFRLSHLSENFHFSEIAMPIATSCSAEIRYFADFSVYIHDGAGSLVVCREMADGVVFNHRHSAAAIASADCPTIVAYCPTAKSVIVAHAGSKSLIEEDYLNQGYAPRQNRSVVTAVMKTANDHGFRHMYVFITCGISGKNYARPDLVELVADNFGGSCVVGNGISLGKVIAKQFAVFGITNVVMDPVDTFEDEDPKGDLLWHSYRRGQTPDEKSGRNLVLVV